MCAADGDGVQMTVCVKQTEGPVSTPVAHRTREVKAMIERQLIVVDPGLQRGHAIRVSAVESGGLPHLRQQREPIAGMPCPRGVEAHLVTDVPVEQNIDCMAVVKPCRER